MAGLLNYRNDPVFGLIGDTYKGIGGLIGDTASNVWGGMDTMDKAALSTSLIPGVGDVVGAINDARYLYKEPTLANAGMAGLGLLPFVPSLGMVKAYHGNEDLIKIADDTPKGLLSGADDVAKTNKKNVIDAFAKKSPKAYEKILRKTGKTDIDRIYASVRSNEIGQAKGKIDYDNAKNNKTSLFSPNVMAAELRLDQMGFKQKGSSVGKKFDGIRSISSYWEHPTTGKTVRVSDHPPVYGRSTANDVLIHPGAFKTKEELEKALIKIAKHK